MTDKPAESKIRLLLVCPYFFEPHRWMISAYKTALFLSKRENLSVSVLTTGKPRKEKINPQLTVFRMWDIFIPDPVNYSVVPLLFFSVVKAVLELRPTHFLVNKHMFFTSFSIPILKLLGKKVITATDTFPGINWFPRNPIVNRIMRIYAHLIGMPLLKMSDKVILYHSGLIEIAEKYKLKYEMIPNGVDLEELDTLKVNPEFIKPSKKTVIYAGRLESIKGYMDILSAARSITSKRNDVQFLLVGSTKGKDELVQEWQTENIIFAGHRNDVIPLMKASDIFVLASYSEGLPNALMEAMSCSLACVSSKVGGVTTLIEDNKQGKLFDAGDISALEQSILELLDNSAKRKELGTAAREKVENNFSWARIAERYEKLFESF